MGGAFGGLVFPRHSDPTQALGRDSFGHWLRDAEAKAGLPKLDGSLWQAYRRSWATSRKSLPLVDVAAAGGWSDVSTLLNCYQQADKETLLEVMSHSRKIREEAKTGKRSGETHPKLTPALFTKKAPATQSIAGTQLISRGARI